MIARAFAIYVVRQISERQRSLARGGQEPAVF
jgi:hypothetical protein